MKINKLFMLAMAGLAFTACNKQNEPAQFEGAGAVTINIVSPQMTKALDPATVENKVDVVPAPGSEVVITLNDASGLRVITLTEAEWIAQHHVTFWNVENPQSVSVSMNGGIENYSGKSIEDLQSLPVNIPVFGKTIEFEPTAQNISPSKDDTPYEEGANPGDENKKYQKYTAEVTLEIPVARLEVSGIIHSHEEGVTCKYRTLTIDGVYMDNIMSVENGVRNDYKFPDDGSIQGPDDAILFDRINGSFDESTPYPEDPAYAYAYNFYGASQAEIDAVAAITDPEERKAKMQEYNPQFKIYFAKAEGQDDEVVTSPRYAMITAYLDKETQEPILLQKGVIYRITSARLEDKHIIGDEGGNTLYGVEVTVVEASWDVKTIDAEWAE